MILRGGGGKAVLHTSNDSHSSQISSWRDWMPKLTLNVDYKLVSLYCSLTLLQNDGGHASVENLSPAMTKRRLTVSLSLSLVFLPYKSFVCLP